MTIEHPLPALPSALPRSPQLAQAPSSRKPSRVTSASILLGFAPSQPTWLQLQKAQRRGKSRHCMRRFQSWRRAESPSLVSPCYQGSQFAWSGLDQTKTHGAHGNRLRFAAIDLLSMTACRKPFTEIDERPTSGIAILWGMAYGHRAARPIPKSPHQLVPEYPLNTQVDNAAGKLGRTIRWGPLRAEAGCPRICAWQGATWETRRGWYGSPPLQVWRW